MQKLLKNYTLLQEVLACLTNNSLTVAFKTSDKSLDLISNVYNFNKLSITKLRWLIAQAQDINQGNAEKGC